MHSETKVANQISGNLKVERPSVPKKPSIHFGFCGFYLRLVRKLPTEELIYVVETIVLMILRHPDSDFSYTLLTMLGNILEYLKDSAVLSQDKSNRTFNSAEDTLLHALLMTVSRANSAVTKVEALKQYALYFANILVTEV